MLRAGELADQRLQRVQRHEFGNPGVAELADVRRGVPGERGEELFVGGAPRQLLDVDPDAGVRSLELGDELGDDFAFAAHGPEADHGLVGGTRAAAGGEQDYADGNQAQPPLPRRDRRGPSYSFADSQPPEKPARSRPRLMCGFFFMMRPTSAVRWFSIIAQMGP